MPAYKDKENGKWFAKFYCKDWTRKNKHIKKRGFETKRDALEFERNYKLCQEYNLDMEFEDQPIRTAWIEDKEEWHFSVVDVVGSGWQGAN